MTLFHGYNTSNPWKCLLYGLPPRILGKAHNQVWIKAKDSQMARQSLHRSYRLQHFNLMVVLYTFPSFLKSPLITAIFFLFFTILSMLFFFLFRGMAYCKYIYPIGSVNTAFARTSPVWLSTYEEECKSCKKPDCALACPYELNPSKFEERKSMMYCTMCMECAHTTRFLHGLSRTALSEYMPWVIVGNYL